VRAGSLLGALLAAALPLAAGGQALATSGDAEGPLPQLTPAWFDLGVNDVPKGQVLVRLAPGDVWMDVEDLTRAGLSVEGGDRLAVGERSLVSLRSLAPAIAWVLDEEETLLRISAAQALLGRTAIDLNPRRRPDRIRSGAAPSAFLNLGARLDGWDRLMSSAELGASLGPALVLSSGTWSSEAGYLRGPMVAHVDDAPRLVRYSAGELFAGTTDPLGGSAMLLGLSAGREFSLDPYVLRDPYPRTSLFVETPSTLEIWVGETLVRRTQVAPGTLEIENLPLTEGSSEVRTVLRDAFGREQSASSFFLMGSNLLAPGLVDWGLQAGVERRAAVDGSISYGDPIAVARWRAGLTRVLTLGARLEASPEVLSGGVISAAATPVGQVEAGVAASRAGNDGAAGFVGLRARPHRRASVAAQLRLSSDGYATSSLAPATDRATARGLLGLNVSPHPRLSLLGEVTAWRMRDAGDGIRGSVRGAWSFGAGRLAALSAAVGKLEGMERTWEIHATWTMVLPGEHAVELAGRTAGDGELGWVTASRSLGAGPGVGYRVQAAGGDASQAELDLHGQAPWGRASFYERWASPFGGGERHEAVEAAAGLVLIDGGLYPTRPVDGSYTLVVLEGAPGVRITRDGQPVGRTGEDGRLLVPGLLPYFGNRITLRDGDVPLDFRVGEVERYVAPRYRAGTVEAFDVGPTRVVQGRLLLRVDDRELAPEWGEIAIELPTGRLVSPIGFGGEFWLEGLTPGRHEALVRWAGRLCRLTFEVGEGTGVLDVGTQLCTQMLAAGGG
jgi:outer membrane usher protein